jgi:hypothetical protein
MRCAGRRAQGETRGNLYVVSVLSISMGHDSEAHGCTAHRLKMSSPLRLLSRHLLYACTDTDADTDKDTNTHTQTRNRHRHRHREADTDLQLHTHTYAYRQHTQNTQSVSPWPPLRTPIHRTRSRCHGSFQASRSSA